MYRSLLSQRGSSLIRVLVLMGAGAVVFSSMAALLFSQQKEVRALSENLSAIELQRSLFDRFTDASTCTFAVQKNAATFDAATFSSSKPKEMKFNQIQMNSSPTSPPLIEINSPVSSYASSLVARSIKLKIISGAGRIFQGQWHIEFDESRTVHAIRPAIVPVTLVVDTTIPTQAKIQFCQSSISGLAAGLISQIEMPKLSDLNLSCDAMIEKVNKITGNTTGHSMMESNSVILANDGSWMLQLIQGNCKTLKNKPRQVLAMIPRDGQGRPMKNYYKWNP